MVFLSLLEKKKRGTEEGEPINLGCIWFQKLHKNLHVDFSRNLKKVESLEVSLKQYLLYHEK